MKKIFVLFFCFSGYASAYTTVSSHLKKGQDSRCAESLLLVAPSFGAINRETENKLTVVKKGLSATPEEFTMRSCGYKENSLNQRVCDFKRSVYSEEYEIAFHTTWPSSVYYELSYSKSIEQNMEGDPGDFSGLVYKCDYWLDLPIRTDGDKNCLESDYHCRSSSGLPDPTFQSSEILLRQIARCDIESIPAGDRNYGGESNYVVAGSIKEGSVAKSYLEKLKRQPDVLEDIKYDNFVRLAIARYERYISTEYAAGSDTEAVIDTDSCSYGSGLKLYCAETCRYSNVDRR